MTTRPTLAEVVREALDSRLIDVHTSAIAVVEKYDPVTMQVDCRLVVRRALRAEDGSTVNEEIPVIPAVPVMFPRGSTFAITWQLVPGDHVMLFFTESSADQWRATGSPSNDAGDLRRHALGSAFAIPAVAPDVKLLAQSQTQALVIGGLELHLGAPGTVTVKIGDSAATLVELEATLIKLGIGATDFVALAAKVLTELQSIKTAFDSHVHAHGTPNTGPPLAPLPAPGSVAATKAKAE